MPELDPALLLFSLLHLVYYFGLSLHLHGKMISARRLTEETAD